MLISLQVISKVVNSGDYSLIEDNLLDRDYFPGYEDLFDFLDEHYHKYGNVPDEVTFRSKFPDIDILEVTESDMYLIDTIREEYLYTRSVPVIQKAAELLKSDSNAAAEYLVNELRTNLQPSYDIHSTDIVASIQERIEATETVNDDIDSRFIPTGFDEIDKEMMGFQKGDELVVIFARTNQGKSWVLEKFCVSAVMNGYTVGYFSPEMNERDIGYRFDTLYGNIPNLSIIYGAFTDSFTIDDYKKYAEDLSHVLGKFYVTKPKDFARKVTVSKLRNWVKANHLDMLAIDGITYLSDERYKRGDSKTISLTNISEDLMSLSEEMSIPILVVVQANRGGVVDRDSNDTPELENIRDSDGIAQNASIVFSVRQKRDKETEQSLLIIEKKKSRIGKVGSSFHYFWDIDTGKFTYTEIEEDSREDAPRQHRQKEDRVVKISKGETKKKDGEDVF